MIDKILFYLSGPVLLLSLAFAIWIWSKILIAVLS